MRNERRITGNGPAEWPVRFPHEQSTTGPGSRLSTGLEVRSVCRATSQSSETARAIVKYVFVTDDRCQ